MSNRFTLFCTMILSFAALILSCIACAGSTKNYTPINNIYVAQINLSDMDLTKVIPAISSSLELSSVLPSYFNIGLWSYCIEDSTKKVTSCTSPDGIEKFNLKSLLYDNIQDNNVLSLIDSVASLILPDKLEDDMTYYNDLAKCMFITIIIGICLSFVCLVLSFCRSIFHLRVVTFIGGFFAFFAFVSLLISVGTSMATYLYIRHILSDNYSDYGISLSLGKTYLGLLWGAVAAALINFICWCFVRATPRVMYVQTPMMEKRDML
ncbi:similar to Saccharomyces cerevisiae YLR414C PUN1 Plasma membrane protein with a role in cell wall integrity [Maudiozyma saulgeensis]|uniref:Similar to Saccharomyces cerevisiae YLR414C PUN1 Plasma membrane protein with a role in cell wall integrity n=1 Tax=Maudiozyma saulgeensis TaxID=1789683 RepID=A0A1X7RB52_9SACH|nr:similar to Saccharomyces cerevisiae YLR414C PUN1 Plasma membrane protein with a role in cell wall integrity [Kazachstania saulgeensis]